ncbi:general substrate transporter [Cryphonectria parasitica EP155]|uniref:General substrate transporter n=1 Tax=Cryphonectria parasitica (strain ATCC 38755 / EP155) TaxID=660469 RepID=A0A9P5CP05_CRYP1|nr:general substrate transporter [Cryphonectria parasitica EP155]KAF3765678.1 general substrate transporter [Cryphonectria parasitica EP155]
MSATGEPASGTSTPPNGAEKHTDTGADYGKIKVMNFRVLIMGLLISLGGFIFGWEGGAISGYTQMDNFKNRFGDVDDDGSLSLGNVRQGLMVGMLCVGCLVGALASAPIADRFGRKYSITFWNLIYIVGNIVCITTQYQWYQVVIGRLIDGFGIGALSVLTPMYQSETAPRQVRGALVSAYQLFITLGIFVSYCVNYGTEAIQSPSSWRITMGIGFIAPTIMAIGMLVMRESPRWEFRRGGEAEALKTLALVAGVDENHPEVQHALHDIRESLEAEQAGGEQKWYEVFTAPAMMRRVLIGMALQALQQLTGANFFFYYGTEIFDAVGISNSFVTSMILGAVNVFSTFGGLYVGQKFGRRISMMLGGLWMFAWLIIFASLGSFALYPDGNAGDANARTSSSVGSAMIASACLFIVGFAVTWGPLVWAIVGEMFPSRYRAVAMGLCTAANWLWNFLISFFTPWITGAIGYRYGYVFAGCCFLGVLITFFFVNESQQRSLEEVDSMYILGVVPWKSKSWKPLEDPVNSDNLHLAPGGRQFAKPEVPGAGHVDNNAGPVESA